MSNKNWVKFDEENTKDTAEENEEKAEKNLPDVICEKNNVEKVENVEKAEKLENIDDKDKVENVKQKNVETAPSKSEFSPSTVITLENVHPVNESPPAVIPTESVQINLMERSVTLQVENIRQGFVNGDVIVTLPPTNTRLPWITPAIFRPELVPEELMAQGLTLTVEEYVTALEQLTNDVRFTLYNVCYKRVLVVWVATAFIVLIGLLFSGLTGITLFALGVFWLLLNAAAVFLSVAVKQRLNRGLEKCLADVNKQLLRHKIVLAVDDRGKMSCHKVNLCFLYMDPAACIQQLQQLIDNEEGWESKLDMNVTDVVIQGRRTTRLSRKEERSTQLYLRYVARWGKALVRGFPDHLHPSESVQSNNAPARHAATYCPCQFIEEHLHCKPRGSCLLCKYMTDRNVQHSFF